MVDSRVVLPRLAFRYSQQDGLITVDFFIFSRMNKLLWLCGIIAFAVISCSEGNRGSGKEKDALRAYDSVLIEREPGFSRHLTEVYWMLYKDGTVTECTRSVFVSDDGKDTVRTVRFSDANGRRVQYLIDDIYVKGTAKDIVAVEDNNHCSDLGGLYIYFYYPGKTVQYQYDWGRTGVKYSSEFKKLMNLLKAHDAEQGERDIKAARRALGLSHCCVYIRVMHPLYDQLVILIRMKITGEEELFFDLFVIIQQKMYFCV